LAGHHPPSGSNDRLLLLFALVAVAGLLLSLANQWLAFGICCWLIMILTLAVGYGRQSRHRAIRATLLGLFLVYSLLLAGIAWVDHPEGGLRLLFGLPLGSALLVYGIWPLGVVSGILYALVFDQAVLPEPKLRAFQSEFGRKDQQP